jgi:hypothetical protein
VDSNIEQFIDQLDQLVARHTPDFEPHIIASMLLSRVTHLVSDDPTTGKALVQYVWEQLDQIDQGTRGLLA